MKRTLIATICLLGALCVSAQEDIATFRTWAMTPPMGWNSWDCYYSSVTEKEVLQNAQYLVDNDLVKYGWEYVVIDIRWYCNHPSLGGGNYNQNGSQDYVLDEYGRYLPSPTRFPSCMVDGVNVGFKPLADRLHEMGLKLGIHLMRGVPKKVVGSSYKLKGSESTSWSQVYNGTTSPCTWLQDNLRVRDNQYGQLYYNSIMDLYAEWGVDFLKIDDLSRPFYTDEIHMIRKAIDQCGRPMVLSLSPGKTQFQYADECLANANMWRMMDDLWDNWSAVDAVFAEADFWSSVSRPGNWADCDMIPFGQISATIADPGYTGGSSGHWTNLTHDEQYTLMTLWGICHSPLFFGGEMTKNDAFTNSLLTNEEYHQMHKYGENAHQVYNDEDLGHVVWTSTDPLTGNRYLALFQRDNTRWIVGKNALYKSETVAYTTDGHAVDVDIEWPEGSKTLVLVVDDGGDNNYYDHGDWINPTLILRDGSEVALTGTYKTRDYTDSYFNRVYENKNVDNGGKMKVMGVAYDRGFSTDANAAIFFTIPDDMDVVRFRAMAAADDSGIGQSGATTSLRFFVFDSNPLANEQDDATWRSGLISRTGTKSKAFEADITGASQLKIVVSDWGDGFAYDRADIVNPVLIDAEGHETSLTTLTAASYTSDWSNLHINKNVEGGTLRVNGTSYSTGLGMNAKCTLIYNLPEGHSYTTFRGLCGYDSSCDSDNTGSGGTTMEFLIYAVNTSNNYSVDLTLLGYAAGESVPVYDIWEKKYVEPATGTLTTTVASHGAKLFRLGDTVVNPEYVVGKPMSSITGSSCIQKVQTVTFDFIEARTNMPDASFTLVDTEARAQLLLGETVVGEGTLTLAGTVLTATFPDAVVLQPATAYTLLLPAAVVGYVGQVLNEAYSVEFTTPDLFDGTYYLWNVGAERFLSINADGSRAIVDEEGLPVVWAMDDAGSSSLYYPGRDRYIAGRWWSDIATGEGTLFHLVPSPDETLDGYRIVKTSPEDPGNDLLYVQVNAGGDQYRVAGNGRYGDNFTDYSVCTWQFWTVEEHDEYITIKTRIDGIATPAHFPADIYSLTGTLIRSHAANADGLPRGIYLIGKRKLLVK